MQLDGYIRVSRVRRRESLSFISPAVQRQQIKDWARFRGVEVLRFHTDLDHSGGQMDRPGLRRAIARIKSGPSDGIVVARVDRFARSLTGALEAIREIDHAGGAFVSVAEDLDPTTPVGKMMMRLVLVVAEFEADRLRESWEVSRSHAVARGVYPASRYPTGYRRGRDGRLQPNSRTAPHVATAVQMRAAFASWPEIRAELEARDVRCAFGGPTWTSKSLGGLISNRALIGEARSGAYLNRSAHPPIVDRGIWEAAQQARTLGSNRSPPTVLGGLLRCAGCRRLMRSGAIRDRCGGSFVVYWCFDEPGVTRCAERQRIHARAIEPLVEERFFGLLESSAQSPRADPASLRRVADELARAERELDEAEGSIARRLAVDDASLRLVSLTRTRLLPPRAELSRVWPRLSSGERRRCIALLIESVFIRRDRGSGLGDRVLVLAPEHSSALPWAAARSRSRSTGSRALG